MRLSLRTLLLVTAFLSYSCAAVIYASPAWLAATAAITLVAILAALLTAIFERGVWQAFAVGFLICAAAHWLVTRVEITAPGESPTEWLVDYLGEGFDNIVLESGEVLTRVDYERRTGSGVAMAMPLWGQRMYFQRVARLLFTDILGVAGGAFAAYVYRRRIQRTQGGAIRCGSPT
jgi:hypothetical protein